MAVRNNQPQVISQDELRRVVAIDLEIARLKRTRDALLEAVYLKLKDGAKVEPGAHVCSVETYQRGGLRGERVHVR
jgi:hypothetical protein